MFEMQHLLSLGNHRSLCLPSNWGVNEWERDSAHMECGGLQLHWHDMEPFTLSPPKGGHCIQACSSHWSSQPLGLLV